MFENRLLFLYYGYMVRLGRRFFSLYRVSFDIYPARVFKKIYALNGKIISFGIELLRSAEGAYRLDYKQDLSNENLAVQIKSFILEKGLIE